MNITLITPSSNIIVVKEYDTLEELVQAYNEASELETSLDEQIMHTIYETITRIMTLQKTNLWEESLDALAQGDYVSDVKHSEEPIGDFKEEISNGADNLISEVKRIYPNVYKIANHESSLAQQALEVVKELVPEDTDDDKYTQMLNNPAGEA